MTWGYGYDAMGNRRKVVDPLGLTTTLDYDALNRPTLLTQTLQLPQTPTGVIRPAVYFPVTTLQGWDGADQLQSVRDPRSLVTSYVRNGLGDTSSQVSPDTGTTGATYDAAGNVLTRTDARGKTTTYNYDALNRLTRISYTTGVGSTFEYDGGTASPKPANAVGRLTKFTDESGSTSYSYDSFGHVTNKVQSVTSPAMTLAVGYGWGSAGGATGKLQTLTYPSGAQLSYSYNTTGRVTALNVSPVNLSGVGTSTSSQPLLSALSYTAWNEPAGWIWGDGVSYTRTWDSYGRLLTYPLGNPAGSGTAAGMTRTLGYDDAGLQRRRQHAERRTCSGATLVVSTRLDYIYADHLDTPRVITQAPLPASYVQQPLTRGGTVPPYIGHAIRWRWDSTEPFGANADTMSSLPLLSFNLRFPGQIYDARTGASYNHHRNYSPAMGRYLQSDPVGLAGGSILMDM